MRQMIAKLERDARDELHSVMGMLELIAEGPLTKAQVEYLRTCRSSADRLLRSIQNVYQFVSPESGKPQTSEVNLEEVVTSVASLMSATPA